MAFVRGDDRFAALGYQPETLVMQAAENAQSGIAAAIDSSLRPWNDAQEANTADSYRTFLFDHPNSRFASEARARLDEIENDPVRQAELAEDALNLSRNERRAIQRNLTLLEFNTRGVDGIFGQGSRGAIRNWQQSNGFPQTSFLTASQINRIDAQASRRAAEIEAEEERARQEAWELDRDYWDETGARGNAAGYQAYLERYPEGIFADEARSKLGALSNNNEEAQAREQAMNLNPVLRRLIESRLRSLGYDVGNVDGRFDRNTRRAIASYQSRSNLTSTGFVDQPTLARLLADTFGR
jgi:peptidoglycan hydrolase-like protein with peptidoglycan-binding domain